MLKWSGWCGTLDYFISMVYSTKDSQVAYVQISDNEYMTYIPSVKYYVGTDGGLLIPGKMAALASRFKSYY